MTLGTAQALGRICRKALYDRIVPKADRKGTLRRPLNKVLRDNGMKSRRTIETDFDKIFMSWCNNEVVTPRIARGLLPEPLGSRKRLTESSTRLDPEEIPFRFRRDLFIASLSLPSQLSSK